MPLPLKRVLRKPGGDMSLQVDIPWSQSVVSAPLPSEAITPVARPPAMRRNRHDLDNAIAFAKQDAQRKLLQPKSTHCGLAHHRKSMGCFADKRERVGDVVQITRT
jgi:hypothetical protein